MLQENLLLHTEGTSWTLDPRDPTPLGGCVSIRTSGAGAGVAFAILQGGGFLQDPVNKPCLARGKEVSPFLWGGSEEVLTGHPATHTQGKGVPGSEGRWGGTPGGTPGRDAGVRRTPGREAGGVSFLHEWRAEGEAGERLKPCSCSLELLCPRACSSHRWLVPAPATPAGAAHGVLTKSGTATPQQTTEQAVATRRAPHLPTAPAQPQQANQVSRLQGGDRWGNRGSEQEGVGTRRSLSICTSLWGSPAEHEGSSEDPSTLPLDPASAH